jgi:purine nucleosidase
MMQESSEEALPREPVEADIATPSQLTRLVIDTDPGVDDAHALMMAFAHPGAKVEAITTVSGNVGVEQTTANACTVLDVLGIPPEETPIFRGTDRALFSAPFEGSYFHGVDGLGNSHYPRSSRPVKAEHAALALIRLANENPGALTLVAIGPLTNLALATRLDPTLPQKYKRLVVMGGTIRGTGNNRLNPSAEFNVYVDPEAAAIVFESWPGLWLLSWETTIEHRLSGEQVHELMNAGTHKADFFKRITQMSFDYGIKRLGRPGLYAPDPLAMAAALEPESVARAEMHAMTVELTGTHTRGQTTVDWSNLTDRTPNVNIILEVDRERFWKLMWAAVA